MMTRLLEPAWVAEVSSLSAGSTLCGDGVGFGVASTVGSEKPTTDTASALTPSSVATVCVNLAEAVAESKVSTLVAKCCALASTSYSTVHEACNLRPGLSESRRTWVTVTVTKDSVTSYTDAIAFVAAEETTVGSLTPVSCTVRLPVTRERAVRLVDVIVVEVMVVADDVAEVAEAVTLVSVVLVAV